MQNESGKSGEDYAARLLQNKGFEILARNYHSRFGEIDIIAKNSEYLVFVEVKTRDEHFTVSPLASVTVTKQKKLWKTALIYLQTQPMQLQPRFDVIGIVTTGNGSEVISVEHIENAFSGGGYL